MIKGETCIIIIIIIIIIYTTGHSAGNGTKR